MYLKVKLVEHTEIVLVVKKLKLFRFSTLIKLPAPKISLAYIRIYENYCQFQEYITAILSVSEARVQFENIFQTRFVPLSNPDSPELFVWKSIMKRAKYPNFIISVAFDVWSLRWVRWVEGICFWRGLPILREEKLEVNWLRAIT